jgi:hypothetical protein
VDHSLKPQDVLLALKLAVHADRPWPGYARLAAELHMSPSEVHAGLRRLEASRLHSPVTRRVSARELLEFLKHGLPYVFPAEEGAEVVTGVPTAWSAEPLRSRILASTGAVWPSATGAARGHALRPLYKSAPAAALEDPRLHEALALVDALRAGRARERALAREALEALLGPRDRAA